MARLTGTHIRLDRENLDLRQAPVAKALGLHIHTVIDAEKNRVRLTQREYARWRRIVRALGKAAGVGR